MIVIKSKAEIEAIRKAGRIAAGALELVSKNMRAGVETIELDNIVREHILSKGAKPSFLGYGGYPASICISVNNEVIHGIPGKRIIHNGDIVSADVGAFLGGLHSDCAATYYVGEVSKQAKRLVEATKKSFFEGIKYAKDGYRLGDIGAAVSAYVESFGFSAVRQYVGHGVGFSLHEDPSVPNYGMKGKGIRLQKGMTLAIEPMINEGVFEVNILSDGWTVVTADGKLSAHFEHTIAITDGEPDILTL